MSHDYVLATGQADVERLRILQDPTGQAHANSSRGRGWQKGSGSPCSGAAAAICRAGSQSRWARPGPWSAWMPAPSRWSSRATWRTGSACRTLPLSWPISGPGLLAESFDLAYCRLVLMHLPDPAAGLRAMRALVRTGGAVVCEEMDLSRAFCYPPSPAFDRMFELNLAIGDRRGVHFRLGSSLHRLFLAVGLLAPEVTWSQPVAVRGEGKQLLRLSLEEFAPALAAERIAEEAEVARVAHALRALEADEGLLFVLPPLGQVCAVR